MRDELELLLKEVEEEQETTFDLSAIKAVYVVPHEPNGTASVSEEAEPMNLTSSAGSLNPLTERVGRKAVIQTEKVAKTIFPMEESIQAGMQAEENARSVYRKLVQVRRAAGGQLQNHAESRAPLTREREGSGEAKWDILQLDRAFQRDARRYDGGFTWQ